ncbi:Ankyrin repeat-containing protein [Spironucleus salmonicida]|uniref:Ankyrin repeat-containing protein n=1 Tax=Spironucleus salmonicida TaxID=348837 RepID=V6LRK4_9EUKA|nr:Ankyrin repeat-containing protein [Spironucleus salmonicida]|eukprot:EST47190.1 Ankyrin repeat-containing protein [Spironucleus salmonicida]
MSISRWFIAADSGDSSFIRDNVQSFQNSRDSQGNTALIRAAFAGHTNLCHLLSCEQSHKNNQGRTALMQSIFSSHSAQIIPILNSEFGLKDVLGQTALMLAAQIGNMAAIQNLISSESTLFDMKQRTALMHAASFSQIEAVQFLCERERNSQDINGMTALMFAASKKSFQTVQILANFEAKIKNKKGETALAIAVLSSSSQEIIQFLGQIEGDIKIDGVKIDDFASENNKGKNGLEEVIAKQREQNQIKDQLKLIQERNNGLSNKMEQQVILKLQNENSVQILRLNEQIAGFENKLSQVRGQQINPLIGSRLDSINELIESNNLSNQNQIKKLQSIINEIKLQISEVSTEFYDIRGNVTLLGQQNKQINTILEQLTSEKHYKQSSYKDNNSNKNTKQQLLETTIQQQQQVIVSLYADVDVIKQDNHYIKQQLQQIVQGNNNNNSQNGINNIELSKQVEENINLMNMLVKNQQRDSLDSVIQQIGTLKVDTIGIKNQIDFLKDHDYDGRINLLEKQISMLQNYIFKQ